MLGTSSSAHGATRSFKLAKGFLAFVPVLAAYLLCAVASGGVLGSGGFQSLLQFLEGQAATPLDVGHRSGSKAPVHSAGTSVRPCSSSIAAVPDPKGWAASFSLSHDETKDVPRTHAMLRSGEWPQLPPRRLPDMAVCVYGSLGAFVYRGLFRDLTQNIVRPNDADVFISVELDPAAERGLREQRQDLHLFLEGLPRPPRNTYIHAGGPEFALSDCSFRGYTSRDGAPPHNCVVSRVEDGKPTQRLGRAFDTALEMQKMVACFADIEAEEHKRFYPLGSKYSLVVVVHTTYRIKAFPTADELLSRLKHVDDNLAACLAMAVDVRTGAVAGRVAACGRGGAQAFMSLKAPMDGEDWIDMGCMGGDHPGDPFSEDCVRGTWLRARGVAVGSFDGSVGVDAAGKQAALTTFRASKVEPCGEASGMNWAPGERPRDCPHETRKYAEDVAAKHGVLLTTLLPTLES